MPPKKGSKRTEQVKPMLSTGGLCPCRHSCGRRCAKKPNHLLKHRCVGCRKNF